MRFRRHLLLILLLSFASARTARAEGPDWQLWSGLLFRSARPQERWDFSGEYQVRLKDDLRNLKSHFVEGFAFYKAKPYLDFNLGYRYTIRSDRSESRLSAGLFARQAIAWRVGVTHQVQYQRDYNAEFSDLLINSNSVRYVFLVVRPVSSRVVPFVMVGGFYTWNTEFTGIEKLRFAAGVRIGRGERDQIRIHYVYEKGNFAADPSQFANIIWVRYEIVF